VGLLALTYTRFQGTPRGFIPSQDMGYMLVNIQLPDSASIERTKAVIAQINKIASSTAGVSATVGVSGQSLLLNAYGSNFGTMFITLDEFAKRQSHELYYETIMNKLRGQLGEAIPDANIAIFGPPPVRGVGRAGGWMLMIEDRGDLGPAELQKQVENLTQLANPGPGGDGIDASGDLIPLGQGVASRKPPPPTAPRTSLIEDLQKQGRELVQRVLRRAPGKTDEKPLTQHAVEGLTTVFRANVPQIFLDVDRNACMLKGVELRDVFETLQAYLGSLYVNDFNRFGRTWQVVVQAMARYRDQKEDISRLQVRNSSGTMVPLGAVAQVKEINGPLVLTRYNMYPAASINGNAARGVSSGTAINAMEKLALRELPQSMSYEWTELAYLELQAGNMAIYVFGFSIVMVFLVLAAQFESWSMPLAVILSVPLCMLSALYGVTNAPWLGANSTSLDINIFTQIGLVVLVGLASKNAILIVQFAKLIHGKGKPIREATLEACRLRLRPIIMTSMAFILGVMPLLFAHGAGAEMRQSLGVAVFSGMLGVTLFGILLTPVFFYVIDTVSESHIFANPTVRRVGGVLLAVLSPIILWRELFRLARRRAPAKHLKSNTKTEEPEIVE
jgi:multidrug efflux pump